MEQPFNAAMKSCFSETRGQRQMFGRMHVTSVYFYVKVALKLRFSSNVRSSEVCCPKVFYKKGVSKIHKKMPVLESLFNEKDS